MAYETIAAMSEAISEHFSKTDMPEAIKAWKAKDGFHWHPIELPSSVTEMHMTLGDDGFYYNQNNELYEPVYFVNDFRIDHKHDSEIITSRLIQFILEDLDGQDMMESEEAIIFGCVVITWDKDESQGELEDSLSWATVHRFVEA